MASHPDCPQMMLVYRCNAILTGRERLVSLASIHGSRKVERNESKSSLAIHGIFEAEDVLMAFGARLELEAPVDAHIVVVDFHVSMIPVVAAVQPF